MSAAVTPYVTLLLPFYVHVSIRPCAYCLSKVSFYLPSYLSFIHLSTLSPLPHYVLLPVYVTIHSVRSSICFPVDFLLICYLCPSICTYPFSAPVFVYIYNLFLKSSTLPAALFTLIFLN